jgi:hypothetical protein
MRNVTVSMDEGTLTWVRVEAARAGMSVSRWLGERLARDRADAEAALARQEAARQAVQAILDHPGWDIGAASSDRNEIHDDRLRRLERGHLQPGPAEPGEASRRAGVAEAPRPFRSADDEPSGSE